jgi:hypothetical protein
MQRYTYMSVCMSTCSTDRREAVDLPSSLLLLWLLLLLLLLLLFVLDHSLHL